MDFPEYNVLIMGAQISQQQYNNFIAKVALGEVPEGKVNVEGTQLNECWEWTAYKNKDGYGQFKNVAGKTSLAHRISAFIAGKITIVKSKSKNDKVLHHCDNTACVNPKHFFIGSTADNNKDKKEKNRHSHKENHWLSYFTQAQVDELRRKYSTGKYTHVDLANEYNSSPNTIFNIVYNLSWEDTLYKVPPKRQPRILSAPIVINIREDYATGEYTQRKLAIMYGVCFQHINEIVHNKVWRNV